MRVLILNDDPIFLDKANRYFFKRGFTTHLGDNGVDGLVSIVKYQPEAIITNVYLNALNGLELFRMVKDKASFEGKFFFISEHDDELHYSNQQVKVFSQKTAFNRILAML